MRTEIVHLYMLDIFTTSFFKNERCKIEKYNI